MDLQVFVDNINMPCAVISVRNREDGPKSSVDGVSFKNGEFVALIFFVGIPIPGTGAWMGSLIASLLEMDIKKAVLAELIGLVMAMTIMSILTYFIPGIFF